MILKIIWNKRGGGGGGGNQTDRQTDGLTDKQAVKTDRRTDRWADVQAGTRKKEAGLHESWLTSRHRQFDCLFDHGVLTSQLAEKLVAKICMWPGYNLFVQIFVSVNKA